MKITKYFLSLVAAAGMIAGCQKDEMVQIAAPEDAVAPVLEEIAEIKITKDNVEEGELALEWSSADFKAPTQINYAIEIAAAGSDKLYTVTTGITDTTAVVKYKTLNDIFVAEMELVPNVPNDVNFYISAKVGSYSKLYSAAVAVKATPTEAVVTELDKYKNVVRVLGAFSTWTPADADQYLFNYSGDEDTYTGVIDFNGKAADGWKMIGGADWDHGNYGSLAQAEEAEVSSFVLHDDGGSKDIKCYSKRYYNFEFVKSSLTLTVKNSFNTIGLVGTHNDWGKGGDDIAMEFNKALVRFYADVTLAVDGELKVRAEADPDWKSGDWGVEEGADCTAGPASTGGNNINLKAGNYRIYLDLNKGTIEAVAKMYGKPEPGVVEGGTEPEPEPEPGDAATGWGVIGVNGWEAGDDIAMTKEGAVWSAKGIDLAANSGWKLRKDGGWDVNVGGPGEVKPYLVPVGAAGFEVVAGGQDMAVETAGSYDIYYDEAYDKVYVLEAGADAPEFGEHWFIMGTICDWTQDKAFVMKKEGEFWVYKGLVIEEGAAVKFNAGSWDAGERGTKGDFNANAALDIYPSGGQDTKPAAGTYDVYMDVVNNKIYFMTDGKTPADAGEVEVVAHKLSEILCGVAGNFNGSPHWDNPPQGERVAKFVSEEGKTAVYKLSAFPLKAGDELKLVIDGSYWYGGTLNPDFTIALNPAADAPNVMVPEGIDGNFDITIKFDYELVEKVHTYTNISVQVAPAA